MNKRHTASAIIALASIGFTACGGSDVARTDASVEIEAAAAESPEAEIVTVTRVIDGPVGPADTTVPEPAGSDESTTTDPDDNEADIDLPGPLVTPDWLPELDIALVPELSTSMTEFARLVNLNPPTISQVHVGCEGFKALVTVEIGGGVGIESVVAERLMLTGTVNSVELTSGTTPGLYEGAVAGWFDSVVITVIDEFGRSVTQSSTFDLAAC